MAIGQTMLKLKKEWSALISKQSITDPDARRAHHRGLVQGLSRAAAQEYETFAARYFRTYGRDFYSDTFEEMYYEYHPEEHPDEVQRSYYQNGQFHNVIKNSLYTLEAYSQGFIGCLIGSMFIGAGTFLGVLIREAIDAQKNLNQSSMSRTQVDQLRVYVAYKLHLALELTIEQAGQMMGISQNECAQVCNAWNALDPNNRLPPGAVSEYCQSYEQENSWTSMLSDAIRTHAQTHDLIENPQEKINKHLAFALSMGLTLQMEFQREFYCDDAEIEKGQRYLKLAMHQFIENCRATDALKEELRRDFGLEQPLVALPGDELAEYSFQRKHGNIALTDRIQNLDRICTAQNKALIFSAVLNKYQQIQKQQYDIAHPLSRVGHALWIATYEAGEKTLQCNTDYLLKSWQPGGMSEATRHKIMSQRPNQTPTLRRT